MLKLIENSFLESAVKVKLQLYILPLFCIYFYFYLIDNKSVLVPVNTNYEISGLLTKKFDGSYLNLLKDIETFCLSKKIKVNSLDYKRNKLIIKGKSTLSKINSLIIMIENINNFSNINLLAIENTSKKNQFTFEIYTEFKKYYIKTKPRKTKRLRKKSINSFKVKAIISNHVLLNNKWYTLNDSIGKYKIIKIEKNIVVLNNKDQNISIKLNKNE
jgi:hypothetical protein